MRDACENDFLLTMWDVKGMLDLAASSGADYFLLTMWDVKNITSFNVNNGH